MVPSDWVAVVHGIESRDLVHPHGRHFQEPRYLVHDADARPAVILALTEIQQRHDGCFLVLRGVAGEDFLDDGEIGVREFERNVGVVFGSVAML